jgi:hypothetical protein
MAWRSMLRVVAAAVFLWVPALAGTVQAHEIAQTQVAVSFEHDRTYHVDICTDPDALLLKLRAASASPVPRALSALERRNDIDRLAPALLAAIHVTFDGTRGDQKLARILDVSTCSAVESPMLAMTGPANPPSGAASPKVLIRLDGTAPAGAKAMTWSYKLMSGTYPLSVRLDSAETAAQWVDGIDVSAPIDVSSITHAPVQRAIIGGQLAVAVLAVALAATWRRRTLRR